MVKTLFRTENIMRTTSCRITGCRTQGLTRVDPSVYLCQDGEPSDVPVITK